MLIDKKIKKVEDFINAKNPASASKVDANANVTNKTLSVLEADMFKEEFIRLNRAIVRKKIEQRHGTNMVTAFNNDLDKHYIYIHDETSMRPYCASVTLYPFLLEGTKALGGVSKAPKNLQAFCGSFVNLVYQLASDFAGAIATVEFLMYFDYFARKTYGSNYLSTNRDEVIQEFQGVVYALNQPAAARGSQSVFWNISVFDEQYFKGMFGEFFFPDGTQPEYNCVDKLQRVFLDWFKDERKKELLTFPVVTAAYLHDKDTKLPIDTAFTRFLCYQMSQGLSFFHYTSADVDSLSSCCRLRNELVDNTFSYSLGAGGVSTGSFKVITLNMNRLVQDAFTRNQPELVGHVIDRVHLYLAAYREVIISYIEQGLLPSYSAGFIDIEKQFGTIGLNGLLEMHEFVSARSINNKDKIKGFQWILKLLKFKNEKASKLYGFRFNTEMVPAENLGVKNAKWDKEDGYEVPRDCYNSYFFDVSNTNVLDAMHSHGREVTEYLDGGSACHINLDSLPTTKLAEKLIKLACTLGVNYWTTNVLTTICKDCGSINPEPHYKCTLCGSHNVDYATRVIGYLKPISTFSLERQKEAGIRRYNKHIGGINL